MHFHLSFTESFDVLEGRLEMCAGKKKHVVLTRGQSAFVPPQGGAQVLERD